jgi:uncharacterized damage-inducible protein DinB
MDQSKLADYNLWANDRVRDLLNGINEEEFNQHILSLYDRIRNLVAHITLADEYNLVTWVDGGEIDPEGFRNTLNGMKMKELELNLC